LIVGNPFTDHPSDVGEGYFEHMGQALSFAIPMFFGAFACLVHAIFPFLCLKTGSGIVTTLHVRMVTQRVKPENADSALSRS
jgi:hypothetical protein